MRFTRKTFFVCCLLFCSPVFALTWEPIPVRPNFEYLVEAAHRIGDHVYLIHRTVADGNEVAMLAAVEFDCSKHLMRQSWMETKIGPAINRIYDRSAGRYAPAGFTSTREAKSRDNFLDWACHLPLQPERLVNVRQRTDDALVQVDMNSIVKTGVTASFWMRYDYPKIDFDLPYKAPFDSKRELVRVDCSKNTYRILFGYDFMPDGAATDGTAEQGDTDTPFSSTDDYALVGRDLACSDSVDLKSFSGIGGDPVRAKAPFVSDPGIDDVSNPPTVLATAAKLQSILPKGHMVSGAKVTTASRNDKRPNKDQTVLVIKPNKDGSTRVQEIYSPQFSVDREEVGPLQLKAKINSSMTDRNVTITRDLTLDAATWAVGARISFQWEMSGRGEPSKYGRTCHIGQTVEASTIHASLAGLAWPLECDEANGDRSKGYYIDELRYFLVTHSESKEYGTSDYAINDIVVER